MNLLELFVTIGTKGVEKVKSDIGGLSDGLKSGLGSAAKAGAAAIAAGTAAAGAGVAAMGKEALDAYASYEQLAGGVEKIFDQANISGIMEDAQNAYRDLNMSANQYMESINQVGATFAQTMGDQKGYDTARQGMKAIADYSSGTGRNLDELNEKYAMITRATSSYQSIADQFSGILPATSDDFLAQAQAAGLLSDQYTKLTDVPVAEYQQAVSGMLEKGVADLGLAGNTARESLTTISGSIAMTKAAWQNLLAEFGKDDGDVGARMGELVNSAKTALLGHVDEATGEVQGGIIPRFQQIIQSIAAELPNMVPQLLEVGKSVFMAIADAVVLVAPSLLEAVTQAVQQMADFISQNSDAIANGAIDMFMGIANALAQVAPAVLQALIQLAFSLVQALAQRAPEMLAAAGQLLLGLLQGIAQGVAPAMQAMNDVGEGVLNAIGGFFQGMFNAGANLVQGLVNGILSAPEAVVNAVTGVVGGAIDGAKRLLGIASPSKVFAGIGENTMLGLQQGLLGGIPGVEGAMDAVGRAVKAKGQYDVSADGAAAQVGPAASGELTVNVYVQGRRGEDYDMLGKRVADAAGLRMREMGYA